MWLAQLAGSLRSPPASHHGSAGDIPAPFSIPFDVFTPFTPRAEETCASSFSKPFDVFTPFTPRAEETCGYPLRLPLTHRRSLGGISGAQLRVLVEEEEV